jgi:hypothetical protein
MTATGSATHTAVGGAQTATGSGTFGAMVVSGIAVHTPAVPPPGGIGPVLFPPRSISVLRRLPSGGEIQVEFFATAELGAMVPLQTDAVSHAVRTYGSIASFAALTGSPLMISADVPAASFTDVPAHWVDRVLRLRTRAQRLEDALLLGEPLDVDIP